MIKYLARFYNFSAVESKWQKNWQVPASTRSGSPYYCLSMFPYPSGNLHLGHVRVYSISDTLSRYHHLNDKQVLHPMGWDAFGLPAENAAQDRGLAASVWTDSNISQMKQQMQSLGFNFDWSRELSTSSPEYYKWTQWLFLQLFEKGLAYRKDAYVNWDPLQKTVLANEQVDSNGRSWRSGALVERKTMNQWYFKITTYAEELLSGLDSLNWPKTVKEMQKGWIGKTEGVRFSFASTGGDLEIYTTKIETVFGVTFLAVSPEHRIVDEFATGKEWEKIDLMKNKKDVERKEGKQAVVLSQVKATHPITKKELPVVVSEYILADYATGCVMGVPAHDFRDLDVAKKLGFEVKKVLADNTLINSEEFTGFSVEKARSLLVDKLEAKNETSFRMKDWLVSRQRYWGVPVPIIHCDNCGQVPDTRLPLVLPRPEDKEKWMVTPCPICGAESRRDADTLDTFVDSSWYYLRYLDPKNELFLVDKEMADQWTPVNMYIGGVEHAIMHLLYARFIHKVLRDLGKLSTNEPFAELFTQGLVLGKTFKLNGKYLTEKEAEGLNPEISFEKMSKSKKNGVSPEEIQEKWGADNLKLAILFAAPSEKEIEWDGNLLKTMNAWTKSIFELKIKDGEKFDAKKLKNEINRAVSNKKLHVGIARLMEYFHLLKENPIRDNFQEFLVMLYPFAPHLAAELYSSHFSLDVREAKWP